MKKSIDVKSLNQLFFEARSFHDWEPTTLGKDQIKELYDLMKWAPTSVNSAPGRFIFLQSDAAKERLYPALIEPNRKQVKAASLTVVIAFDQHFYEKLNQLWPAYDTKHYFTGDAKFAADTAFRNSSLQGAYMIMAARALGWDVCALSGFDNEAVDREFFAGTELKSNFILNVGVGKDTGLYPRGPRLTFEETAEIF